MAKNRLKKNDEKVQETVVVNWPSGEPQNVRAQLLKWHQQKGRSHLPWIATPDANGVVNDYHIAVSEVMMQQTTVAVGLKRFPLWMETFPTWQSLAQAPLEDVMKAWEGLGYYARARSLHKMAQTVVSNHNARIPQERSLRLDLPGVGPTTASALGAFVYGAREPIWDANVNRIWKRWWGDQYPSLSPREQKKWEWEMAQQAMPNTASDIRSWTQAVMDLGATVCAPKTPNCSQCPWNSSCRSYALGTQNTNPSTKTPLVRQEMWKNWVWVVHDNTIAVAPPHAQGIWSGLWQLPQFNGVCPLIENPLHVSGQHKLSHRDVQWSIVKTTKEQILQSDNGQTVLSQCQWRTPDQWHQLALPQPLRKWWDGLSSDERSKWIA